MQPPSGGCVLKPLAKVGLKLSGQAAAFVRLCVETANFDIARGFSVGSRLRAAVC